MDGRVQETLSEGLDNVRRAPFIIEKNTGIVKLNFDPQKGMKGYFDFKVNYDFFQFIIHFNLN